MLDINKVTPEWLAGFFDGEGCVCATLDSFNGRKLVKLRVTLTQKKIEILALILIKFPDAILSQSGPVWHLIWSGKKAKPFLSFIKEYVIVKREQVFLGLELVDLMTEGRQSLELDNISVRQEIRERLQVLNFKGLEKKDA